MEVVHVLRAEKQSVPDRVLQVCKGSVRGVWLAIDGLCSSLCVEAPNEFRVCGPSLPRGDFLEAVLLPKSARVAECADATLGADAGSGQDEDSVGRSDSQGAGDDRGHNEPY